MSHAAYPMFRAAGSHRELGRQHGEQAAPLVAAHLELLLQTLKLSRPSLREKAATFRPLFERHCPHLLDELRGLAEGARVSLDDALAVNLRGTLAAAPTEGCTTFAIGPRGTADGQTLIGQNSDIFNEQMELGYVLHLKPIDKPEVLMWTFGGMIGYHGVNSAGVCHFANDLGDGGPAMRFALAHYPLKRLIHEQRRLDEVLELFQGVPVSANGNYMLCDGSGAILDVEATSAGPHAIDDGGAGYLVHTNHFLCAAHATADNLARSVPDSPARLARMQALVAARFGQITLDDVRRMLADHADYPVGICRHARCDDSTRGFEAAGRTCAALIAEPSRRLLHIARGNPCEIPFTTYAMQ